MFSLFNIFLYNKFSRFCCNRTKNNNDINCFTKKTCVYLLNEEEIEKKNNYHLCIYI